MSTSLTRDSQPLFDVYTDYSDKANPSGTSFHGVTVRVKPSLLIEALGDTRISDDYKISKEWIFIHKPTGAIFTLYDWKETSLYDNGYPSPSQVWSGSSIELHIGHMKEHIDIAKQLAGMLESLALVVRAQLEPVTGK